MKTSRETCAMIEQIEIAEQVYKGEIPSKTIIRWNTNRDIHVSKIKGG